MSRLPTVGSDDNNWGGILNDFLSVEHNADGTQKSLDVSKLTPGSNGQVLTTSSGATAWAAPGGGGSPSGSAGGSLAGTYPNPTIAAGAVTTTEIADGTITNTDVSGSAAIAESKLNLASDAAAGTASRRTLGSGATQAAAGNDSRLSDARTPTAHQATHQSGGSDALSGNLDANARLAVAKSGTTTGTRRKLNLIPGSNVSITTADDGTGEKVDVTIAANPVSENVSTIAASGASQGLDLSQGFTVFDITLTAACTITFSNAPTAGSWSMVLRQDSTGGRTVTWPASFKWPQGIAPVLTTTATTGVDILSFATFNSGTTFYGFPGGSDMR